jgi:hypothetical protein
MIRSRYGQAESSQLGGVLFIVAVRAQGSIAASALGDSQRRNSISLVAKFARKFTKPREKQI